MQIFFDYMANAKFLFPTLMVKYSSISARTIVLDCPVSPPLEDLGGKK